MHVNYVDFYLQLELNQIFFFGFSGRKRKESTLLFAPGIRIQILKILRKLMVNDFFLSYTGFIATSNYTDVNNISYINKS